MNRKEEIIYATLELASLNGMQSVSMAQIAEKVGIKAPSLYNHFASKDEIIREMYGVLREQARKNNRQKPVDYSMLFEERSLEEILTASVSSYMGMILDKDMMKFFKVLYSERATNPTAAKIMIEETEHMLAQTRDLFYALAVHGKIKNEDADMAAMTYALTLHSLIDHRMDMITAGDAESFADPGSPVPVKIVEFIKWFSMQIGGNDNE
ncbi:MAG: TetR/AcrR family transcriptional regulator [Clostridiales bacterium]|jgi:AcrR family transcriptional regulator|nr:TetR/AcrR family transcriptional regulator [Clostridiales bacterium]